MLKNFFDKYVFHYENSQPYLRLGLKPKKTSRFRIQSITSVRTVHWIQHTQKRGRKDKDKDEKAFYN